MLFAIFTLLFFASVCVVAYSLVSNLQAEKQKDAIVPAYRETVADDAAITQEKGSFLLLAFRPQMLNKGTDNGDILLRQSGNADA